MNELNRAKSILGYGTKSAIARACKVTPGAVQKWFSEGTLPASEITEVSGKRLTAYGLIIEKLTDGAVTDAALRAENQKVREVRRASKAAA